MRALFSIVGLLVVLAIVGVLAKNQLNSVNAVPLPATPGAVAVDTPVNKDANVQQQFKAAAEAAVQQPRDMPDDK